MPEAKESINQQAEHLVNGDRQWSYDHPLENCERIGIIWGVILDRPSVEPEKVALMLAGMKIAREVYRHKEDNLVDLAGYSACTQMIHDRKQQILSEAALLEDYDRASGVIVGKEND